MAKQSIFRVSSFDFYFRRFRAIQNFFFISATAADRPILRRLLPPRGSGGSALPNRVYNAYRVNTLAHRAQDTLGELCDGASGVPCRFEIEPCTHFRGLFSSRRYSCCTLQFRDRVFPIKLSQPTHQLGFCRRVGCHLNFDFLPNFTKYSTFDQNFDF